MELLQMRGGVISWRGYTNKEEKKKILDLI